MLKHLAFLGVIFLGSYSFNVLAINCQRAATLLENTICSNDNLNWLDSTLTEIYHSRLVNEEGSQVSQEYRQWRESLEQCTSDTCIERAYYKGISQIANPNPAFNWQGLWWNMLAPNRSGSTLQFMVRKLDPFFSFRSEAKKGDRTMSFICSGSTRLTMG